MLRSVKVRFKPHMDRSYAITIRAGLMAELPATIARAWRGRSVFIITDTRVGPLLGRRLHGGLEHAGMHAVLMDIPAGERSKNGETVRRLYTALLQHGIDRQSLIVALGGGVVGDVAGFVAATVLRGVRYIQVPTSLVAQLDSSIGGKVGIDLPIGKNLVGAFHQPSAVYIDPQVLESLPARQFREGLAELVKIAAALDVELFRLIEKHAGKITPSNIPLLRDLIGQAVALKASIVQKDELETGLRKTLNLGHTIGHAIEAASRYRIKHGEAVAMGLSCEARMAVSLGLLREKERRRLAALLTRLGLPTAFPATVNVQRFQQALSVDKKRAQGSPRFVLLRSIGHSVIDVEVPTAVVAKCLSRRR